MTKGVPFCGVYVVMVSGPVGVAVRHVGDGVVEGVVDVDVVGVGMVLKGKLEDVEDNVRGLGFCEATVHRGKHGLQK